MQTLWMNVYRAGWFHRKGKEANVDMHAGDFYVSKEDAEAAIEPRSHYVATVSFDWHGEHVTPNPVGSVAVPLSVSRREHLVKQGENNERAG